MSAKETNLLILDGHPDPSPDRFIHSLANAYESGALEAKHQVMHLRVADLEFPLLRTKEEYERGQPCESIYRCLDAFEWATHIVIFHPLWLGTMPALLKGLLEQVIRPGFAFSTDELGRWPIKYLRGRTARIVVTMGMSVLGYRLRFGVRPSRDFLPAMLATCGVRSVRTTLIGGIEHMPLPSREAWLGKIKELGRRGR